MGYVDLHSHVVFGVDDGAPDPAAAAALLDGLAALGITEQCLTPHQKANQFLPDWALVEQRFAAVQAIRTARHPTLRLGAENMWDDVFYARIADQSFPHYAGTNAFLFEVPPSLMPPGIVAQLFKFRSLGKLPVLAHPERYHDLWDNPRLTDQLRANCAFVVDLGAVGGFHGKREAKAARALLEAGLAHAVATDAHQLGDLQQAQIGLEWIAKKLGAAAVTRLFDHAPRQILAGELPD